MSLRWKLMLLLVVIVGGVTTSVGIISYQSTQDRMMTEIDNSLGTATNVLLNRRDSDRPGRQNNGGMIVIPDRPLGIEQYVVQLTDRNGNILAATTGISLPPMQLSIDNQGIERPVIATLTGADGIQYRVRAEGFSVGIVQLGRDLSEVENVLTDLRSRTVLTGVIVALLSAILGWVIAASMTSRLANCQVQQNMWQLLDSLMLTLRLRAEMKQQDSLDHLKKCSKHWHVQKSNKSALFKMLATNFARRSPVCVPILM